MDLPITAYGPLCVQQHDDAMTIGLTGKMPPDISRQATGTFPFD
jgi:hypothetical protein